MVLVGFLFSEEAGYITDDIISIDGGMFKVQNVYLVAEHAKKIRKKNRRRFLRTLIQKRN